MEYTVKFTPGARRDLRAIFDYIFRNDSKEKAGYVIEKIVEAALTLRQVPLRGARPPELLDLGIETYRQIFFKPYRIFYTLRGQTVFIAIVADGRRDMQSVIAARILGH